MRCEGYLSQSREIASTKYGQCGQGEKYRRPKYATIEVVLSRRDTLHLWKRGGRFQSNPIKIAYQEEGEEERENNRRGSE